jgi:thiol-disulfide isomerase/thioredoxin
MKITFYLLILLLIGFSSCKTTKHVSESNPEEIMTPGPITEAVPPAINFSDESTWLLGYFNLNSLKQAPHSAWFIKGYDEYQLNTEPFNRLLDINIDNVTIRIVLGTWCPDSRREVPKFIRILDIWNFPISKVKLIGVDKSKLSSVSDYGSLNIERVPTFIIYKNNIEAGRIIENPVTSLEQDMLNILTRNK